jgi:hypothetical protein
MPPSLAELDRYTRLAPALRIYRGLFRQLLRAKRVTPLPLTLKRRPRVLIVGIYLADRPNTAAHLAKSFAASRLLELEQCWAAMLGSEAAPELKRVTTKVYPDGKPKFPAINELIAEKNLNDYDFVVVCDDDIVVPLGFIDAYITTQIASGLAIAQAARTPSSCGSKPVTIRERGTLARQTRFVEIGPLFSLSSVLFDELLPFDESNPMGWGFDYHWPLIAEAKALQIGIIDRTPVDHSLRPLASAYSGEGAKADMNAYLARNRHLTRQEAELTLRRLVLPKT